MQKTMLFFISCSMSFTIFLSAFHLVFLCLSLFFGLMLVSIMQIVIVIVVVFAGVFEVDVSNWSPFMPNGFKAVVTGATVVFFAYVGFDAVANSAEEAKSPQVIH
jgi:amino acid transporter